MKNRKAESKKLPLKASEPFLGEIVRLILALLRFLLSLLMPMG